MAGMTAGFVLMLYIKFYTPIAWTWYVLIGSGSCIVVALLASRFLPHIEPSAAHGTH